jgi:cytochrome b subunit of formate dehydrogenase
MIKFTKEGDQLDKVDFKEPEIEKYTFPTILAHWMLIFSVTGLILTGAIPLINKVITYLNLINITIPVVPYSTTIHTPLGFFLIFGILFVIFTHKINLQDIFSGKLSKLTGSFFRSFIFIIGFEKRLESGGAKKFYGYQKITFIFIMFSLWILMFSGVILYINTNPDASINQTFMGSVRTLHLIGTFLIIIMMIYHLIMTLRRFDGKSLRCIFIDGKLPLRYVKEKNRLWYDELTKNSAKK